MKIADNLFVSIDYRLTLESGEEVDRSAPGSPLGFIAGAGMIIPGLEKALMGMSTGEKSRVHVEPEEGYGPVHPNLFQEIPRGRFPAEAVLEPGATFQAQGPRGPVMLTVSKVEGDTVTVDLNHPLAGKKLIFDVTVAGVRAPNALELESIAGNEGGCGCGSSCGSGDDGGGCGPEGCGSGSSGSSGGCGCR